MDTPCLSRMIKPLDGQPAPDLAADSLAGILAKSAAVVGLLELDTQLEASSGASRQIEAANFIQNLPENGLYMRMECEVEGQIGLLALDPDLINAIDDVLTGETETVTTPPETARTPTAIDSALCQPYLNAILAQFYDVLQELRGGKPTELYVTKAPIREPSAHMFPDIPYIAMDIELDMAEGARKGRLTVMLPKAHTSFASRQPRPGETAASWKAALEERLLKAKASLDVVLHRKSMPIGEILRLKSGDILEIPARALENLSVESQNDGSRKCVMRARLGEYQEMRAAKITRIDEAEEIKNQNLLPAEAETAEPE